MLAGDELIQEIEQEGAIEEKEVVIEIRRVTKVTKGGKRLKFRAVIACGNQKGEAGFGVGKASEV
ncbi:MAG TPA: hypothetical protein P5065_08855, partial [Candidatus Ratteibacteria bacterium]|nr:hypothetical protein [Candidatus Ratteibacteria bacterium]